MNNQDQNLQPDIRCGTDLVEIERIRKAVDRLGQGFLDRIWTKAEQADCIQISDSQPIDQLTAAAAASLAARFAAKEAVSKALGTGFGRAGIHWTDIAVHRLPGGAPQIILQGAAQTVFDQLGGCHITISLAHERTLAIAFCVLSCQNNSPKDEINE